MPYRYDPRVTRSPRWAGPAIPALLAVIALSACAPPSGSPPGSVAWHEPRPTRSATPSATPSPTPTPTPSPSTSVAPELAPYLSRIPRFDPAPTPAPVTLSRYDNQAAFAHEIPTNHKVAFLTIDDGLNRHPLALELLRAAKIPVTLFLTTNYVGGNQAYFQALRDTGYATIQNHTVSHPNLPSVGYAGARNQLCGASNNLEQWYGKRPTFFRPPFGEYDNWTLRAAWECGLQAGFHWRETVDSGNVYYQRPDKKIHAGDIILMHFRPAFPEDFIAALVAIKAAGLTPALLEDYVSVGGSIGPAPAPPPPTPTPTPAPEPTPEPTQPPHPTPDPTDPPV